MQMPERIPVAVLGATGLVGQHLVARLAYHPWFTVVGVAASAGRVGRPYGEAVQWQLEGDVPAPVRALPLVAAEPGAPLPARIIFSALPAAEAEQIEPAFARAGAWVFSNASAYRMEAEVPLVVPEINPTHLAALRVQQARRGWRGGIVTNPNCSTVGLTLALAPLVPLGLEVVQVVTLQSASGAGYPGVAALDLIDNIVPHIPGEEDKIARETRKILGEWTGEAFVDAPVTVSAQCTRVPVREGHLACVQVQLAEPVPLADLRRAWHTFAGEPQQWALPTAPERPLLYREEADRPQPLKDRLTEGGMTVSLGRLQPVAARQYTFVCLVHNLVRGAAGAALLNAELAVRLRLLDPLPVGAAAAAQ